MSVSMKPSTRLARPQLEADDQAPSGASVTVVEPPDPAPVDAHPNDRLIYSRPPTLADVSTRYCPGCGHGVIHRLIAEVLDELGLAGRTIAVAPVGCSVFAYDYLMLDFCEAPHGRAPAVATGIRRVRPDNFVLMYQGDGDLAAIGTGEIVHCAARGELITGIFVNNGIYGMTGGQMAPTTLLGQRTTSSPTGRDASLAGYPIRITEMLAQLPGVAYAARGTVVDPSAIGKTRAMIKRACQVQQEGRGFALVEILSNCPIGWGMTPQESIDHIRTTVIDAYPLGVIVDRGKEAAARPGSPALPAADAGGGAPSAAAGPVTTRGTATAAGAPPTPGTATAAGAAPNAGEA